MPTLIFLPHSLFFFPSYPQYPNPFVQRSKIESKHVSVYSCTRGYFYYLYYYYFCYHHHHHYYYYHHM